MVSPRDICPTCRQAWGDCDCAELCPRCYRPWGEHNPDGTCTDEALEHKAFMAKELNLDEY